MIGIRKRFNILIRVVAILLLLFISVVLVCSIPSVQTYFGGYATNQLNEQFGTDIRVDKVGLQFNGDIELKNILIRDHHNDTLIAIEELNSSIISFIKIKDNNLIFKDIDIYGLFFHIKTYADEGDSNLDIFVDRFESDQKKTGSPFKLSSDELSIYNSTFKLSNSNKTQSQLLDFKALNIEVSDFWINGPNVHANIQSLNFNDPRGVVMKNFQTDFNYRLDGMTFDDLNINTSKSQLQGHLKFSYQRADLKNFSEKVNLEAHFSESTINLGELNIFYPEFGQSTTVQLTTDVQGTLNDLMLHNFSLNNASGATRIEGQFSFKNLISSKSDSFMMLGQFQTLRSNYSELKAILPRLLGNNLPSNLKPLGNFSAQGDASIFDDSIDINFDISTAIGQLYTDLKLSNIKPIDSASYSGQLNLMDFDLGVILNEPKVGLVNSNLTLEGKGFTIENVRSNVNGICQNFEFNNYTYKDIEVQGFVKDHVFKGALNTSDPNLKLDFEGLVDFSGKENIYDFTAEVSHANLRELNFVTRDDISVLKGRLELDMRGTNFDDAYGNLKFKNALYTNQNDVYYFEDFQIFSTFDSSDNRTIAINSPEIIQGIFKGKFKINQIPSMLRNAVADLYSQSLSNPVEQGQYLSFNFKIFNKIIEVFYPKLKVGTNTFVKGFLDSDPKKFLLTFKSPNIELEDYLAEQIQVQLANDNPIFNTYIQLERFKTPYYEANSFNLINVTLNDTLYMKSEFRGGKQNKDLFDLNWYYTLKDENSVVGLKPSKAIFKGIPWQVNGLSNSKNKIIFNPKTKTYFIEDLDLSYETEQLILSGQAKDSLSGNLNLKFKNVDLAKVTPEIDSLSLGGTVNGNLVISKFKNTLLPKSLLNIEGFSVNGFNLGAFNADVVGNSSLTSYDVDIRVKDDRNESFSAIGLLDVSGENSKLDVSLKFENFILEPLNPLVGGVITEIRGKISGQAEVTGRLEKPQINGSLGLDGGHLFVPYLNVKYAFDDQTKIDLQQQSFIFKSANFTDTTFNSNGVLSGKMSHNNFSNWSLDINIDSPRLLVLNTSETNESLYYGTGFVDGNINIEGPMNQLFIEANVATSKGTIFKIPLNDSEMIGENSYIKFLSPEEKQLQYEGRSVQLDDIEGVEMEFNMDVTDDAEIEIVLDKDTGSSIVGRGNGSILAQINTSDKFLMYGDFLVLSGYYNYSIGKLVQKKFKLVKDGTLVWEGNPLQAEINIEAIYDDLSVNPSTLLDNPINQTIPVEVKVQLTEALEKPNINFDIRFPNINSALNSELADRLRDKDKREFQALSLLATGAFRSKIALDTQDAFELVSDGVTNMLNDIFSDDDNKVKLGLNLDIGKNTPEIETDSRVGVTLSTKISENVLINGKVGVPIGGVSQTTVAGDFEVEVLLNEDRTLSLKFFNRENSIQNFGDQIGYTQGLGLSYNIEFDNLKELLSELFSEKKITQQDSFKATEKESEFPEYMEFKKSNDNE